MEVIIISRITKSIGVLARFLESRIGDVWLGIKTDHSSYSASLIKDKLVQGLNQDSHGFQTNSHNVALAIIKTVKPSSNDTIIVIGCAKGRALCHFGRLPVKKVIGIEISDELAKQARENAQKLRGRKAPIEIIEKDVVLTDLSEGTIFYMFNPFGATTLRLVLEKIQQTHKDRITPTTIIYVNPKFAKVFNEFPFFQIHKEINRKTGLQIKIYKSTDI